MTLNVQDPAQVKGEDDTLPYTEQFTYLGSIVDTTEEQEATSATELVRPGIPSG